MKKILILILFIIILASGIFLYTSFFRSSNEEKNISSFPIEIQEKPVFEITNYYILVSALPSSLSEITQEELVSKKIYSLSSPELKISLDLIPVYDIDELISSLYQDFDSLGLVLFEDLNPQMKIIPVDNQNILATDFDPEDYLLQETQEIDSNEVAENSNFVSDKLTRLLSTGEIILARGVAERIEKYQDILYPFHQMKDYLQEADLTISTLEAPIYSQCQYCDDCMVFCGKPEYLDGLTYAGIDGVTMAANHIKDFGSKAIFETSQKLAELEIGYFGAGQNFDEAHQPWITTVNGLRFGFLGYNDVVPESYAATENTAGSAWANIDEIEEDVKKLRPQVDILILMMHWGVEYTNTPNSRQQEIAYASIDAGADLIIGDHPHWVQGIEFYQNKFIIYGLGNFVFDQMWSEETRQSVILDLFFYDKELKQLKFNPIIIEDYVQPRFATFEEEKIIMDRIWEGSQL